MNASIYNVKCPHCGKPFSIESALEKELSGKLREKIETEVRKIAEEEMQAKSKLFKKDLEEKSRILKEVQERESELLSKQTELLDKVENAGIDFQRRLIEEREKIKEQAEKMAVKLIVPMAVFIFPAVVIVLAGPAGLTLLTVFG